MPQCAPGTGARVPTLIEDDPAVDDHRFDPFVVCEGIEIGRSINHMIRIEDNEVRELTGTDDAAIA